MRLKVGDLVQVITGDDKGTRGKILRTLRDKNKVVVEGVNRVYKHVKRGHPKAQQGGRLSIEMPINVSNVMLVDPQANKPTRLKIRMPQSANDPKVLVTKKSGTEVRKLGKG
ncbi:MAG: 50S ribosomal protein L24 [Planctomycetes bacterium]|nr:50S ribosomal protein L24 [Planctomycetota bacterium]